ncbi:MAG: hypothetical protein HC874_31220, partial [Richelia sp. SL_2_1]|nr:hypothetical protein [Richelia sp. SL_2_1]
MTTAVISQLKLLVINVSTTLRSAKWADIGKYIVLGMIQGINDNRLKFIEKVKQLAKAGISAAQQELGIKSPSIVFREIGANLVEGFKIGVKPLTNVIGSAVGVGRDIAEKNLKNVLDPNKIKPILSNATANFRKHYEKIKAIRESNLKSEKKKKRIEEILLSGISLRSDFNIKGGIQAKAVSDQLKTLVNESFNSIPGLIDKVKNEAATGLNTIANQMEETVTKFGIATENVRFQTNSTRNSIEDAFSTPLTDAKLFDLFNQVQSGVDFGKDLNDKIKLAYLSQNKLNGALEDQLKVEEQIRLIGEAQAELNKIAPPHPPEIPKTELETGLELLNALKLGIDAS